MEGVFYVDSTTVPLDEGIIFGARLIDESTGIFVDWDRTNLVLKKEFFPDLATASIPIPQNTWVKVKLVFSAGRVKFFYATGPTKTITLPSTPTFNAPGTLGGPFSFIFGLHRGITGMSGLAYLDDFSSTVVPNTGSVLLNAPAITFEGVDYNEFNQIIATGQGSFLTNPACKDHPKFYLLPAVVDCIDLSKDLHTHAAVADLGVPVTLTVYSNGLTTASSEEALLNVYNLFETLKFGGIATDYEVKSQGLFAKSVSGSLIAEPTPADVDKLTRVGSAIARPDGTFRIQVTTPLDLGSNILFAVEGKEGEARLSQRIIYNLRPLCTAPEATANLVKFMAGDDEGTNGDDDEGRFIVAYGYSNTAEACEPVTCIGKLICGTKSVSVDPGQIVEIENDDEGCEIEYESGQLEIEGSNIRLEATCTNSEGSSTATAQPLGLEKDNDQETERDD